MPGEALSYDGVRHHIIEPFGFQLMSRQFAYPQSRPAVWSTAGCGLFFGFPGVLPKCGGPACALKGPQEALLPAGQPLFAPKEFKANTGYQTPGDKEQERWSHFYSPEYETTEGAQRRGRWGLRREVGT